MQRHVRFILIAGLMWVTSVHADDWPAWRGVRGDGVSYERGLPIEWDGARNVIWKTAMPGPGNSSPIVWKDRVFITTALDKGKRRAVVCLDRATGKTIWISSIDFAGDEPTHDDNPYCSATPTTDGDAVYAWFGSAGMIAYDMNGQELWRRDLGPVRHQWGNASSPVLLEDMVIVHVGPSVKPFMIALNKRTGQTIWEHALPEEACKDEKEYKGSWSTPMIVEHDDQKEMIMSLPGWVMGFNPYSGQEYWRCGGLSDLVYTSPLVNDKYVIAMSGFTGPAIGLRRPGAEARGDITATHRLWRVEKNAQRVGTGVLLDSNVFMLDDPGIARCIDAASGNVIWEQRVGASSWGSMLLGLHRLYVTDQMGVTHVLVPSREFNEVAKNPLGDKERTRATPAFSDGQIFIRTYENLYCIGTRRE